MILSANHEEHEVKDTPAFLFDVSLDGKPCRMVTRVDSRKLTFDVYPSTLEEPERKKARYVGIFLREKRVEILSALPVKEDDEA